MVHFPYTNESDWRDWRWQMRNTCRSQAQISEYLDIMPQEKSGIAQLTDSQNLPLGITPHYLSLIDPANPHDPLRAQLLPRDAEFVSDALDIRDPLGEVSREVVPHLIHRYPDRVLFLATDRCASYCRFCTRKRWVGQGPTPKQNDWAAALNYIRAHSEVREVILSGGDPLVIGNRQLEQLLSELSAIEHVDIIRIHTRILTFAPMRVDAELVEILRKYQPVYVVTHFNHPNELTASTYQSLSQLASAGIPLLNQNVLLKGINDCPNILSELYRSLVSHRVKPYYLHQCDLAPGTAQFRVPLERSLEIIEAMRGHISGLCMPTFVVDLPNGHGKVPIVPDPILTRDDTSVVLKGFKGGESRYPLS